MQVKTSRIDDVLNEKQWDGKHGRVWYYTLVLDNGDKGEIGTKTRDSYSIGDTLNYTLENTDHGYKLKRATKEQMESAGLSEAPKSNGQPNPQPTVKNFGGRGSEASFALSYAKDHLGKAMEYQGKAEGDPISINQWTEAVLVTAAKFNQFLKENA